MNRLTVGIGELKLARGEAQLVAYAIGSCIALCLYDTQENIGAMGHILLPGNRRQNRGIGRSSAYYADEAIYCALEMMLKSGCSKKNIIAAVIGGATMFAYGNTPEQNIGQMNIDESCFQLQKNGIPLQYAVTGGTHARTVVFSIPGNELSSQISIVEAPRAGK